MNQLVRWLEERERDIAAIYHTASLLFADDSSFSSFLGTLAAQENDHGTFLDAVEANSICPPMEELKQHFTTVIGENMESILKTARNRIADPNLTKRGMIELTVALELSEWNSLFLYVMERVMKEGREFQRMVAEIERHRQTIDEYLEQLPDSEEYLQIIRHLAPLWKKRILVLDDDPAMTKLITILMAPYGELEVAKSGRDALQRLERNHFDVVISDVEMPGMTGIDFYRRAVTIDPAIGNHFLFLTGTSKQGNLDFIKKSGARQLKKPTKLAKLREAVVNILHAA